MRIVYTIIFTSPGNEEIGRAEILSKAIKEGKEVFLEDLAKEYGGSVDKTGYEIWTKRGREKYRKALQDELGRLGYKRLAGEVESRNAERRTDFTPQMRRERLLAETEDVAREDQFVITDALDKAEAVIRKADNKKMELKSFIDDALANRDNKDILQIGYIDKEAQYRINQHIEADANEVYSSKDDVRHAYQEKHNLEYDDLLQALNVINTTKDISLSPRKHADSPVLVFKKDINGEITFLTEVHAKKGYLEVFDCWRQKKVRNRPDAARIAPPGANVQDVTPTDTSSSTTSPEKSSPPSRMEELFQLRVKGVDEDAGDAARMGAIQTAYEAARTDERGRLREFGRFADMVAAVRDEPDAEALKEALAGYKARRGA